MIQKLLLHWFGIIPKSSKMKKRLLSKQQKPVNLLQFTLRELNKN